ILKRLKIQSMVNLNFTIKDLTIDKLDKVKLKCVNCSFWTDNSSISLFDNLNAGVTVWEFIKSRFFEIKSKSSKRKFLPFFIENGGIAKVAFSSKKCIGILLAGKYYLFPKLKLFNFYPPDPASIFLGCIYVLPEYRNLGVGKKLLISLEKDLIKTNVCSIESVAKRIIDDIDIDEYVNSPIIPIKFLIKNGFYIKENDEVYPLLRLDLSTISMVKEFLKTKFAFKNVLSERVEKSPANFRN
ncbi:MAG: GNAT family N-acetyltransferase, partial [Actinobacteria bacterium]|nr:GNAT family N-acetyltransferase [Actinomycetota bacterium]